MQVVRRARKIWQPGSGNLDSVPSYDPVSIGASIFQMGVREIDGLPAAKPGDLVAALAWLTGRMAQTTVLSTHPEGFTVERTSHGTLLLRSDLVTNILANLEAESLASVLVRAALMSGARRFPDIFKVRLDSMEALERHGLGDFRGVALSGSPEEMAAVLKDDLECFSLDQYGPATIFNALVHASVLAIGYCRHRIEPALGVELALSVAFHAGWIDQRKSIR